MLSALSCGKTQHVRRMRSRIVRVIHSKATPCDVAKTSIKLQSWHEKRNLKIKRDLPSRCLIAILLRHQSGTKELHEKHAHAYLVSLKSGSVSRRKSRNEGEGGGGVTAPGPGM